MINQRGDTIIEVVFAVTIFAMIAVLGLSTMNKGAAIAQRSLEIDLVRQQIDTQANALRYIHNAYISNPSPDTKKKWEQVSSDQAVGSAEPYGTASSPARNCAPPDALTQNRFAINIMNLGSANVTITGASVKKVTTVPYAQLNGTDSEGLWIQAVHPPSSGTLTRFYDFHIRACWSSTGQSMPIELGTIVRLYDPIP